MAAINLVEEVVVPESPTTVENQVMHFFVPLGNYDYPGALKPFNRHFELYGQGLFKINLINLSEDLHLDNKVNKLDPYSEGVGTHAGDFIVTNEIICSALAVKNPQSPDIKYIDVGSSIAYALWAVDTLVSDIGKIDQLRFDVDHLDEQVDSLFIDTSDLRSYVNSNLSRILTLSGSVSSHTSEINLLRSDVDELEENLTLTERRTWLNATNLTDISAQVKGIARTYVLQDFLSLVDFMNGNTSIAVFEDRNGDQIDEVYEIFVHDLKTGDNVVIIEHEVPDFWFEKTNDTNTKETYEYYGQVYELVAPGVGLMHKSETDYVVIGNYAQSASVSADQAKEFASNAKNSENKTAELSESIEDFVNSIYIKQVAPPLSILDKAIILTTPTLAQI